MTVSSTDYSDLTFRITVCAAGYPADNTVTIDLPQLQTYNRAVNAAQFHISSVSGLRHTVGKQISSIGENTGKLVNNANYVSCVDYFPVRKGSFIAVDDYSPSGYYFNVALYTFSGGEYTCFQFKSINDNKSGFTIPKDCWVRFGIRKQESNVTATEDFWSHLRIDLAQNTVEVTRQLTRELAELKTYVDSQIAGVMAAIAAL